MKTIASRALVLLLVLRLGVASADSPQTIYQYSGPQGRPIYVNGLDNVPERYRAKAQRVDLSKVSLNEDVGRDLRKAAEQESERLTTQRLEAQRKAQADAGTIAFGTGSIATPVTNWAPSEARAPAGWRGRIAQIPPAVLVPSGLMLILVVSTPLWVWLIGWRAWSRLLRWSLGLLFVVAMIGAYTSSGGSVGQNLRNMVSSIRPNGPGGTVKESIQKPFEDAEKQRMDNIDKATKDTP